MDVYNLILDRGYLGALKYANEIEGKNFRLASEIDQIVSELYRIASGKSFIKTAQIPRFRYDTPYSTDDGAPTPYTQTQSEQSNLPLNFRNDRPAGMPEPTSALTGLGQVYTDKVKSMRLIQRLMAANPELKNLINRAGGLSKFSEADIRVILSKSQQQDFETWLRSFRNLSEGEIQRVLSANQNQLETVLKGFTGGNKLGPAKIEELMRIYNNAPDNFLNDVDVKNFLTTEQKLAVKAAHTPGGNALAVEEALKASTTGNIAKKGAAAVSEILARLGEALPWVKPLLGVLGHILGPLALAFDTYGIFKDFEEEGMSPRVTCKIISAILGLSTFIAPFVPGGLAAEPIFGTLWLFSSIGCGFIPKAKKEDSVQFKNSYQNLTQSAINSAEGNATLEELSKKDQDAVKNLFSTNTERADLKNNARDMTNKKVFENPLEALAVIQKRLRDNNGKVVPF